MAHLKLSLDSIYYFVLAAEYIIPVALCIRWRVQNASKPNFYGLTFVILMLVGCLSMFDLQFKHFLTFLARMASWSVQPFLQVLEITKTANFYWNIIPSFTFSSNYMVILFMW